jgi:hypothetical protein
MAIDENDRLRAGTLPAGPEEGARPMWDQAAGEDWNEPLLFEDDEVPAFPLHALPVWLGQWAKEQATAIQVAPDLPAWLGLAVMALATTKKVCVEIKPGWYEPTNVYTAVALAPGEGKSPAFAAATAPLREWERDQRVRIGPQLADAEVRANARRASAGTSQEGGQSRQRSRAPAARRRAARARRRDL